jgi:glycosyltransferase involved in cell wall biosynthesis
LINVLHIIDSGGLYGAEIMLLNLMMEQVKLEMKPILASIGLPGEKEKTIESEAHRHLLKVHLFRMRPGPNLYGAISILKFARQHNVSLIHTHGYKANIFFGLMPKIVRRIPMVTTLHGWTWVGGFNRIRFYEWLEGISFHFIDQVVLVNEKIKQHPRLRILPKNSISIIENGISINRRTNQVNLRQDISRFTKKGFTIGAIGRLSSEKGFELLIESIAELVSEGKDFYLVLLGEGKLKNLLETRGEALGLKDRLLLPGYVADAASYMPLFDLFILSSFTEGLPMVLLEAMAAEIPIVATNVGGVAKTLNNGSAGLLIKPGSKKEIKDAVLSISKDPKAVHLRVSNAKQRVQEKYSSRAMALKYKTIYETILMKNKNQTLRV